MRREDDVILATAGRRISRSARLAAVVLRMGATGRRVKVARSNGNLIIRGISARDIGYFSCFEPLAVFPVIKIIIMCVIIFSVW